MQPSSVLSVALNSNRSQLAGGPCFWHSAQPTLLRRCPQVGATLALLRRGLAGYHPRALGLFAVPLRPLRAWLPAVAAGLATFPLIDWVHKRMVALLALEEVVARWAGGGI